MKKTIIFALLGLLICTSKAQSTSPENTTYVLKSLYITGLHYVHPDQVRSLSGLVEGEFITLPGYKISDAFKRLYDSGLFEDIQLQRDSIVNNEIFLSLVLKERKRISEVHIRGLKKKQKEDLFTKTELVKGSLYSPDQIVKAKRIIQNYLVDKGYYQASINLSEKPDDILRNSVVMDIGIEKGQKTKINRIILTGNETFTDAQLKKPLKSLPKMAALRFWKKSSFSDKALDIAKKELITYYRKEGFRDVKIKQDSISINASGNIDLFITIEEGNRFYHRNIHITGNYAYSDSVLIEVLGIKSGDIYSNVLLDERLYGGLKHPGLSALYLDNGYLFFNINPIETGITKDSIDLELRIQEGAPTTIGKISIRGNTKTNDEVILRMLRTQPGNIFRRADLMRSQRELIALNYFDPTTLNIIPTPNQETGTVDLEYRLTEKPSDQIQLSGGWSPRSTDADGNVTGGGLIGTLQLTLNNFSTKRLFQKESWKPLPAGDGQQLRIALQSTGRRSNNFSINFQEPWLGGKKPTSLGFGFNYYRFASDVLGDDGSTTPFSTNSIAGSLDFGTFLTFPDDYTQSRTSLAYRYFDIQNPGLYYPEFEGEDNAYINSFTLTQTFTRNSLDHPMFPTTGSFNQLVGEFTPPYSLFGQDKDYDNLSASEKFNFLEYYKLTLKSQWFTNPIGKLVLQARLDAGYLGAYNSALGVSPFERFVLGGAGIMNANNGGIRGIDPIPLRGYKLQIFDNDGSYFTFYNRLSFEVRHPIDLSPQFPLWVLGFAEAGNASEGIKAYRFADIKKSVGLGLRMQVPMIGLLGLDWGYGFDKDPSGIQSKGQIHFIFGREF